MSLHLTELASLVYCIPSIAQPYFTPLQQQFSDTSAHVTSLSSFIFLLFALFYNDPSIDSQTSVP